MATMTWWVGDDYDDDDDWDCFGFLEKDGMLLLWGLTFEGQFS